VKESLVAGLFGDRGRKIGHLGLQFLHAEDVGVLPDSNRSIMDLAVVPLAIPMTIGPGSVGALVVMSGEIQGIQAKICTAAAITCACIAVGILLYLSPEVKRLIGRSGISMLSKLTGLILSALSCPGR
jgi:multiple antibiotic resistance protein